MSTKYISSNWRLLNKAGVDSYKSDNYGLTFDGNEFINCGSSSALLTTGGLSVSWWMKTTVTANDALVLMDDYGAGNRNWQIAHLSSGNVIRFYVYGSPNAFVLANTSINDGNWHHVVCTYEPSTALRIYIDGSLDNSNTTSIPATRNNSAANLTIGKDYFNNYYTGDISEVSVFDYALSSTQISTLYGSSSLGAGNPMALKPAPVAYYPLGDNSASNPLTQPNEAVEDASVFDFDSSSSQYIDCGDSDTFSFGNSSTDSPFSISAWINMDDATKFRIVSKYVSANREYIFTTSSSDLLSFALYDNSSGGRIQRKYNTALTSYEGQWIHVVGTYDGNSLSSGISIYLNGTKVDDTDANSGSYVSMENTTQPFLIGSQDGTYSNGKISNTQIWSTELSSSEVSTLYNSGVPLLTGTQPQASSLRAWYKLDQSANWEADTSGAWQIPDAISAYPQSFEFDGSNHIEVNDSDSLSFGNGSTDSAFSVSTWVNFDDVTNSSLFSKSEASNQREYSAHFNNERIYFGLYSELGSNYIFRYYNTNLTSLQGSWAHFVFTYDGSRSVEGLKIYLNNSRVDDNSATIGTYVAMNNGTAPLKLGRSFDNRYLKGKQSNTQIWNTELSSSQIETLYNNGVPLTTAIASDNLKAWYKLDNTATFSTNWSIPDASGNGNTGTSSGMTEQNLVNNNVSVLNGESSGMTSANLVLSDLTRAVPDDSYSFNFDAASTDYIQTTSNSLFNGLTAFSISCWIKTNGTQLDYTTIFGYQSSTSQYVKLAFYPSEKDRIRVVIRPGTTNPVYVKSSAGSIVDGEWVHIVAIGDANNLSNLNLYINGILDNDVTQGNITTLAQSSDIYIGTDAGAITTREFNGKISNISVFNEALTSTEVLKLYSNGVPQNLSTFTPQPVAWYPLGSNSFWNGSQWTVRDMIGSNDGTGQNIGIDGLVGDAPRSEANGTGTNMDIPTNLEGSTKWSSNNSWSINMSSTARVEDTP